MPDLDVMRGARLRAVCAAAFCAIIAGCAPRSVTPGASDRADSTAPVPAARVTVSEGTMMSLAASPDGKRIVLALQGTLFTLSAQGGDAERIAEPSLDARNPVWSPDGKSIAFESNRDGIRHIYSVGVDGNGLRQLTSGDYEEREPAWSPDATSLAFSSDRTGNFEIWEMSLASGATRQVTSSETAASGFPVYAPGGDELAYISQGQTSSVISASRRDGSVRRIVEERSAISSLSWSPDGKHLVYAIPGVDSSAIVLDGQRIGAQEDIFPFRTQWLSATEFVYTADGVIRKRELASDTATSIPFKATLPLGMRNYERATRDFTATSAQRALGIMRPVLAPNGTDISFAALGDLWIMPKRSKPKRLTDDVPMERDPAWSRDGVQLLYSSDRGGSFDLWVRDMKSGKERRLTQLPGAEIRASWSHDNRQVVFVYTKNQPTDAEVWVVDVASGATRMLEGYSYGPGYPTWSGDDSHILIPRLQLYARGPAAFDVGGTNQLYSIPVHGGAGKLLTPFPNHSFGKRTADGPVISPDGARVAFEMKDENGRDGVWVMPVDRTGAPAGDPKAIAVKLTQDSPEYLSWSADSKQLLYLAVDELKLLSIEDRSANTIPVDLTWQQHIPAGRRIVHAGRLVDGVHEHSRTDMDIVLEGNRIVAVEPHRADRHDGEVIDATQWTVMPGLIDMHVHLMVNQLGTRFGRAYLAYGVTGIRIVGAWPYEMLEQREAIDSGRRPGPRIFGTGHIFEGPRVFHDPTVTVASDEDVAIEIDRARRLRYDWIKTYAHLPAQMQQKVVAAAHAAGLPVTSHDLFPSASFGTDGVEHIDCCSDDKTSLAGNSYDDVVQILAKSQMAITPTFFSFYPLAKSDAEIYRDKRWTQLLSPYWDARDFSAASEDGGVEAEGHPEGISRRLRESVVKIARAGGLVLAGTDSAYVSTPYGVTLHSELAELVKGGMSPFEALRIATVNNAKVLRADLGTIEPGKIADLVIVKGDPLENIDNARNVIKVISNGELLELPELLQPSWLRQSE